MKIICISGKAQSGKDFVAIRLKALLSLDGSKVLITHFADLLKYMCKTYFSWNGEKDAEGRYLLQHIGTEVFREYDENYWVDFIRNILKLFPDKWDYVVIPDCRFPNEIERFKEDGFDVVTMRLERSNSGSDNSGMNTQNKKHSSETALDEYDFDEFFINYGDIRIVKDIEKFVDALKEEVV